MTVIDLDKRVTALEEASCGLRDGGATLRDLDSRGRQSDKSDLLNEILAQRIVVLDGAIGTMI